MTLDFLNFNNEHDFLMLVTVVISLLALINAKRSSKIAERSLKLAERTARVTSINNVKSAPTVEFYDVVDIDGKQRVKLLIFNLKSTPFKINSLNLKEKKPKPRNIRNFILSMFEPEFDWDFQEIQGYFWNPKGELDDSEHYVKEAGKFLVVKDFEIILVTVPNFSENKIYRFELSTTHGDVALTGSVSKYGKTLFCTDFYQTIS